jgi:hypothetical protein
MKPKLVVPARYRGLSRQTTPKVLQLHFYECEHEGDLERYIADIEACEGRIVQQKLSESRPGVGAVDVAVPSRRLFRAKFQQTPSSQFLAGLFEHPAH